MKQLLLSPFQSTYTAFGSKSNDVQTIYKGEGNLNFVFDAGMGNWSLFFKPLAERLTDHFNTYLLDRPGYSLSKKDKVGRDAISIARNMKQQLLKKGIKNSIILVGHSMGGLNVRMFQSLYPHMVKGMILIDAANPNLFEKMPELKADIRKQIKQMKKIHILAKLGLLNFAKSQIPTFNLPDSYLKDYYRIVTKSFYYKTYIEELQVLNQSIEQCKRLPTLGELPLLVISSRQGLNNKVHGAFGSMNPDYRWIELQKELASLSSNSIYLESKKDHFIHLSDTEMVVEAIHQFYNTHLK